jgi:hypothetical protein
MEPIFSVNASIRSAGEEIPRLLLHENAHYPVYKTPILESLLSENNPVHTHNVHAIQFNIIPTLTSLSVKQSFTFQLFS